MEPNQKDIYRLWWEYLKLSDDYKKYCISPAFRKQIKKEEDAQRIFPWPEFVVQLYKTQSYAKDLTDTYESFGNVHTDLFDEFWERKGKDLKLYFPSSISNFSMTFELLCRNYEHLDSKGRPNLKEFQKYVLDFLNNNKYMITLEILFAHPVNKIEADFKKLLNKKFKTIEVKVFGKASQWFRCKNLVPTPNVRMDEVKRYLEVLKVYKDHKLKGKEAFKKVIPDGKYSNKNQRRAFFRDKEKGERILKNVEAGYFPGYYESRDEKVPPMLFMRRKEHLDSTMAG